MSGEHIGQVQYFLKHGIICDIDGIIRIFEHVFAYIHWYKEHRFRSSFGTSAVVSQTVTEESGPFCFLPVQRILCTEVCTWYYGC